ncbi:hypothetical protein chiPu_0026328 [Chiloscyllium punctatum]|uniref:Uncharacterized protein n=1 Tax=Chiloscyllium punctatum TaxID=137246 RepID=A0A401TI08_CHIPU|nr:hypothetical protein [Chiloscyllium punctatum]
MRGLGYVRTRRAGSDFSKWPFRQLFYGNDSFWIPNDAITDTSPMAEGQWADIYWGLLEPENGQNNGIQSLYNQWRPWVQMLHPYAPPADPLHVTLYYDRDDNEIYQHAFYQHLEGTQWDISSSCILVGKEGVAGVVELTAEQLEWYEMSEEAIPHVTLAVHAEYQIWDLCPNT